MTLFRLKGRKLINNLRLFPMLFVVCFSGEILCPGTRSTCKPRSHFCDLHSDCPGRTDEQQCCMYIFYFIKNSSASNDGLLANIVGNVYLLLQLYNV